MFRHPRSLALLGFTAEPLVRTLRDALGRVQSVRTAAPAEGLALPEAATLGAGLYVLKVQQGRRLSLKLLRD